MYYRNEGTSSKKLKKHQQDLDEKHSKKKKIYSIKKLIGKEQYSKALRETEEYLELYPNDSYGLFQLGCIYYEIGDVEEAKEQFHYIIDNNLDSKYSSMYKLAYIDYNLCNIDSAEDAFLNLIKISPYPEVYSIIELSNIYLLKGEKEKALNVLHEYGNIHNDEIVIQEAIVQNTIGNTSLAYENLTSHNFGNNEMVLSKYYEIKGILEGIMKRYDESESSFEMCYTYASKLMLDKIKVDHANIAYKRGDYEKSYKLAQEILNNKNSEYRDKAANTLGKMYMSVKDYDNAIKYFLQSVEYQRYPTYLGYYHIAEVYTLRGEFDQARDWYCKVLKNSKNKAILNSSYLRLAFLAIRRNDRKWANRNFNRVKFKYLKSGEKSDIAMLRSLLGYYNADNIEESYLYSQITNYSIERLVEHINKEHYGNGIVSNFREDIDLEQLVLQIPEYVKEENLCSNYTFDTYRIKYDNAGYTDGKMTDCIEIIMMPGTKKIITMYPYMESPVAKIPKDEHYTKKKSQIDKFNQRYGDRSDN